MDDVSDVVVILPSLQKRVRQDEMKFASNSSEGAKVGEVEKHTMLCLCANRHCAKRNNSACSRVSRVRRDTFNDNRSYLN